MVVVVRWRGNTVDGEGIKRDTERGKHGEGKMVAWRGGKLWKGRRKDTGGRGGMREGVKGWNGVLEGRATGKGGGGECKDVGKEQERQKRRERMKTS